MFTQVISVGLLATSALASQAFSPVHNFGAMLPRDDLTKRQGYYPTTSYCGTGDTCAEACSATYEQCPSDAGLYCFDPTIGEQCCPDGTGNSCDEGYYCTSDGAGTTYCCPNDLDLSNCAAAYSLTVSLIKETGTPSAVSSTAYATTTPIHVSSLPPKSYPTASYSTPIVPTGNATYTGPEPPQFTGAAAKVGAMGVAMLAGAAGLAGVL